jgi:uncharacterized protein
MSKPDASGAKSLEEILASIRKSLAGDASEAGGKRPAPPATPEPDTLAGDRALSQRLAGALGQSNGAAQDDDFTDLLAPDSDRRAEPPPAPPADARSEGRDPLWFLKRPAEQEGPSQPHDTTARAAPPPEAPGPRPPDSAEIKLSRPEVLRASLPPLFGSSEEPAPVSRAHEPAKPVDFIPAAPPRFAPVGPGETTKQVPDIFTAKTQPVATPAAGTPDAEGTDKATPATARTETARTPDAPMATAEPAPVAARSNGLHAPARSETVATSPEPVPAMPEPAAINARTLEGAIGELLEPVIRQWLQANLPRLVEEMVRKEVARVLATDRGAAPKRDAPPV